MKQTTRRTGGSALRRLGVVLAFALVAAATLFAGGVLPASAVTNPSPGTGTYAFGAIPTTVQQGGSVQVPVTGSAFTPGTNASGVFFSPALCYTIAGQTAADANTVAGSVNPASASLNITVSALPGAVLTHTITLTLLTSCNNPNTTETDTATISGTATATITVAPLGAPTVTSVSPTTGAQSSTLTINGSNFTNSASVTFSGTPTVSVAISTFVNSDQVTATVPATLTTGQVYSVSVTTAGGPSTNSNNLFTVASNAAPTIASVSPPAGGTAGGNAVTITGTGLTGATSVTFGTFTSAAISNNVGTSLTVIAPAGSGGPLSVTVNTPSGNPILAAAYTYTNGPVVTGISPTTCPTAGGTSITVAGFNFSPSAALNTVTFGGTVGTVTFANVTGSSLNVTCPARTAGIVDVIVTVASVASPASLADQITYANTGPAVSSIFPTTGPTTGGTTVTVTGQNFTGATQVLFGGVAGTVLTQISATQVSAIAPAHLGGATVDVQVTTAQGTSPANPPFDSFTYADTGAPVITAITPATDAGICGQVITVIITGTNFTAGGSQMTVLFGGVAATSFTVNGTTQINAILPPHSVGAADVRVTVGNGAASFTLPGGFTYTCAGVPTVTGVSPTSGAPGSTVTITGSGFTGAVCPAAVSFGGVQASACTVVSDTSITATVPTNVPSGTSDVRVTNASGQSAINSPADNFTNSQSGATVSYTLYPTYTLIGWVGQNNITAKAALSGPSPAVGTPPTTNVTNVVTVIWRYDAASQTFKAYFPGHDTDGLSDFTTLQVGVGYFIGMAPGTPATTWVIQAGS